MSIFGYQPPGTVAVVRAGSGTLLHIRSGENFLDGTIRLRCGREVKADTAEWYYQSPGDATCEGCKKALAKAQRERYAS